MLLNFRSNPPTNREYGWAWPAIGVLVDLFPKIGRFVLLCCAVVRCGNKGVSCGDDVVRFALPLVRELLPLADLVLSFDCGMWYPVSFGGGVFAVPWGLS